MYLKDKDKKKLMIAIGFFCNIVTFTYILFDYHRTGIENIHFYGLFGWGATPLILALFFSLTERLFNLKEKIDMIFKIFLFIIISTFIIFGFVTYEFIFFASYMSILSIIIIVLSIFLIIKFRDLSSFYFLLSQTFFTIAGYTLGAINSKTTEISDYFPIFSFYVAFIFLTTIFIIPSGHQRSTNSVFSIMKELELSERKRKESISRYNALFNSHLDLIYIYDFKGNFIDANEASLKLTGYTREEIKNLNFKDLLDKGQLLKAFQVVRDIRKNGFQSRPEEFRIKCKDGKIIDIDVMSSIIYEDGKRVALQGIAHDISERKRVEQEILKEKLFSESLLESLPGILYFFDEDGKLLRWNKNFETILEYNSDEILKMNPLDLFSTDDKEKIRKKIDHAFMMGETTFEAEIISKTNKRTPFYFSGYRLTLNDKKYLIGVGIDLSDLKQTQLELQHAHQQLTKINKDLEKKVDERTTEIKHLLDQKDEFINQLGHDLKNPLGPLLNLLPILKEQNINSKNKEIFEILDRNINYMQNLVVKTIQLASLNSPNTKLNYEDISLLEEINNVIDQNKYLFIDNNIKIKNKINENLIITADKLKLTEVFNNLINNSVKYSNEEGKIIFDAKYDNKFVTISVEDDGVGMTDRQKQLIFDEFYKADSSRHDFDSSGLGLPICKRIIEKHGGKIWVESSGIGRGSIFYFTIPINKKSDFEKENI
jgi:PAS domain S-box-containing protein